MIENAVIAAAGFGSRLGRGLPKCMVKVGDYLIIDYLVNVLKPYVKNIILVVGYRSELVVKYCEENFSNIKIVINHDYKSTNTAYSYSLGSAQIKGKCLFLDGDLIISEQSMLQFLSKACEVDTLLGITKNITQDPVYVKVENNKIIEFMRGEKSEYEWANIFCGDARLLDNAPNYVYEELQYLENLYFTEIDLQEVDTELDYLKAIDFIKRVKLNEITSKSFF